MKKKPPEWAMKAALIVGLLLASPTHADENAVLERALARATATFEAALPHLAASEFGVDVAAYRDALTLGQFASSHWGGTVTLTTAIRDSATGSCGRYAAFVRIPPENGTVSLVICPQFFTNGADDLRRLTVLHEMVHVVAGSDECQAMAFAARVEMAASGRFTPVDAYWSASGCAGSGFRLPE
jgi:hypothetical protein